MAGLLLLAPSVAQAAGTTTGIVRAHSNLDVYAYTPNEVGYLTITIGWTKLNGDPVGGYPQAEVDVCVQSYDGCEPYADLGVAGLASGLNPSSATIPVYSYNVRRPYFFSVSPFVGDVRYRLTVDFRKTPISPYTRVIDATGEAHATAGDVLLPATATWWHSVFHYWKAGPGDALANWDEMVASRNGTVLIDNRAVTWKPPIVSSEPARSVAGTWVTFLLQTWNGSTRPPIWSSILDTYPMPGSLTVSTAPAWYTWAYTDSAAATSRPAYAFRSLFQSRASGCSLAVAEEPGATVSYSFVGDTLSWVYAPPRGAARRRSASIRQRTPTRRRRYGGSTSTPLSRSSAGVST